MLNTNGKPFEKDGKPYGVIGERIKEALKIRRMKQIDLVKRTGIASSSISEYVSGKNDPKQVNMYLIAKALMVRPDWLMGIDVPMEAMPEDLEAVPVHDTIRVPILGKVAAGEPMYTEGNIEGEVMIDPAITGGRPCFALRVKGDSMTPQILDQDIIIVREQEEVDNGNIVVATVGTSEGCVKRLKKYPNAISLVSVNPMYEPMYFPAEAVESLPVRIWGKVVEIRRAVI